MNKGIEKDKKGRLNKSKLAVIEGKHERAKENRKLT